MMQLTPVVKQLLIINIIFFVGCYTLPHANDWFGLHYYDSDLFHPWQFFTYMFMHGGLLHIFFNMFALVSFGGLLEHFWGSSKFLFFYISCGLGAALVHMGVSYLTVQDVMHQLSGTQITAEDARLLLNANYQTMEDAQGHIMGSVNDILNKYHFTQEQFNVLGHAIAEYQVPTVGASGAIYGLLVAFAFMFPYAELSLMFIPIPIKAKYFVPILLCIDLIGGLKGSSIFGGASTGIAHFAHLGGALTGFIMMWIWRNQKFNQNRWN
jgi:membrane associated rhomboid family serine protease